MGKSINIFNKSLAKNESFFYERLERDLWAWNKCFNCDFCWDIKSETWIIKDSIIECLWIQAWIKNIKIDTDCYWHRLIENYRDLRIGD